MQWPQEHSLPVFLFSYLKQYITVCVMNIIIEIVVPFLFFSEAHGDLSEPSRSRACDILEAQVIQTERKTELLYPPPLAGKWVSERCEVRSGPEFLLRSHSFFRNSTFRLTEFHYADESCSVPLYTVTARGKYTLRGRSWLIPGATDADYTLTRVTVTAHSAEVAEELATRVNATCPGQVKKRWKPYKEYVLLNLPADSSSVDNLSPVLVLNSYKRRNSAFAGRHHLQLMSTEDIDCLSALHAVFHELQLIRIQRRPIGPPDPRHPRLELLLGDVHSRLQHRSSYRPSAFQTALLRADRAEGCDVCHAVARGWERSPPQLLSSPRLPALLSGEWVSVRCETRPLGLFLTRRLRVSASVWHADYRFFSDSACVQPTLIGSATGHFVPSPMPARLQGATDFDFRVEQAFLTLLDQGLVTSLQHDKRCGADGLWEVGKTRDVTPWHGCAALGIVVPSTEYEVARVEISPSGTPMLLLGQADSDNARRGPQDRPTAYQSPLLQCAGQLPPFTHFLKTNYRSCQMLIMSSIKIISVTNIIIRLLT